MILIAYLSENLPDCNENLAWGNQEPLVHSYVFWYKTKVRKQKVKTSLHSFHVVIIRFKSIQY